MSGSYDVIVLGAGGVGAAAMMHLARRGVRVLGLDRFQPPHCHGSSHGDTRVIRQAYFEHPDYVPLLLRAYVLWRDLEREAGCDLFHQVGLLEVGPADGVVVPGVLQSARQFDLRVEQVDHATLRRRLPAICLPESMSAVFEPEAGYLAVEACVAAHLRMAEQAGAELRVEPVVQWKPTATGVEVRTSLGAYAAARLVIAAGAGACELLRDEWRACGLQLCVHRKHLHWHGTEDARLHVGNGFPTFFVEEEDHSFFYGFPQVSARGVKVAEHSGGVVVDDPLQDDKLPDSEDQSRVRAFLARRLPTVHREASDHAVCYYTMTPDGHFLVDRSIQAPQVCYVAGLSGHGFKFTGVLGEALCDLALESPSRLPLGFLAASRFQTRR